MGTCINLSHLSSMQVALVVRIHYVFDQRVEKVLMVRNTVGIRNKGSPVGVLGVGREESILGAGNFNRVRRTR